MALSTASAVAGLQGFCGMVRDAAAVFQYCRRIVELMANMGKDAQYLEDQVYIEHTRFVIWQTLHDLVDSHTVPLSSQFRIPEIRDSVQRILARIQALKEKIENLAKPFGLEFDGTDWDKTNKESTKVVRYVRTNTSLQSEAVTTEIDRKSIEQDRIKKKNPYWRKAIWAVKDFRHLQELVSTLSTYNDQLAKFTQPMALGVAQEALIKLLPMPTHNDSLESRIASIEMYKDVSSASLAMKQEIDAQVAAWKADAADADVGSRKLPARQVHGWQSTMADIWDRKVVDFDPGNGEKKWGIIEWKSYNPAKISTSYISRRADGIVSTLQASPEGSAVLRAAGWIEDSSQEGTRTRLALLYELPPQLSNRERKPMIRTLRQMLSSNKATRGHRLGKHAKPPLGQRFKLAAQIAEALGTIHNCGWLHKGMRPENIVFLCRQENDIENPYILGWAYSRRNSSEEQTDAALKEMEDIRLYQHPAYIENEEEQYCEAFDHYQFGCLLVEIAWWKLLADVKEKIAPNLEGEDWSDKLIEHAQDLKQDMGEIYSSAMESLLRGLDPDDSPAEFWFDVVWKLRKCTA